MLFRNYLFGGIRAIMLFAVMMALFAVPASAQVLYDNGSGNGAINGWGMGLDAGVADSFTLSGPSTLTGVNLVAWMNGSDTPVSVEWEIGTGTPFDLGSPPFTILDQGTGSFSTSTYITTSYGYSIDDASFGLPNVSLPGGATTYWLVLQNSADSAGYPFYWDESDGPSTAYCEDCGGTIGSESFQILGTTSAPEPGTLALLGIGLLCLAPLSLRRRVKSASFAA